MTRIGRISADFFYYHFTEADNGTRMTRIRIGRISAGFLLYYLFTEADNGTRMTRIERISADFFILSFYWSGQWNADDADEMD